MGPMELLLIVILALIVFGPAKLPEIMGQIGKAVNDFRRATTDLSDEFNKTIQAELQESRSVIEEAKSVMTEARTAVADVHSSVNSAVSGTTLPAPTRVAEPSPNGNGSAPYESKPALADTSQWSWETATQQAPEPVAAAEQSETIAASTAPASSETVPALEPSPAPEVADATDADIAESTPTTEKKSTPTRDDLAPPY
jgi:TatA/E family protein of Tat protein translocase